jgi:hypothetical protein
MSISSNQNLTGKHVIYIDVDDEITGIIDKVRSAEARIIALVLPKRATVLQSIVNMKLLKRTADEAKKHIVLITAEAGLLPLAGSVGLYVASTLQSKPEIPEVAGMADDQNDHAEETVSMPDDEPRPAAKLDLKKSVGDLAGSAVAASALKAEDSIELDDDDELLPVAANAAQAKGGKKNKKLKIPNFSKFRLLLVFGVLGLVLLGVLLYVCTSILPKASITIKTDSQSISTNLNLTLNTGAKSVSTATNTIPATLQQTQKTLTQQATASGQQNQGAAASGTVTLTSAGPCASTIPSIPNGTALSASVNGSNLTYITQSSVSFSCACPKKGGSACDWQGQDSNGNQNIAITAQSVGAKYNTGSSMTFTLSSYSPTLTINGSASNGTDNIVQIVQQSDIDGATQKLGTENTSAVKQELQNDLTTKGLTPVTSTFNAGTPAITTSVAAGTQAANVTVNEAITYTMLGVKQSDLQQIVAASVNGQINKSSQTILDYGLSSANFTLQNQQAAGALVGLQVTSVAGSQLNVATIKSQVAGKKAADAETLIKANPGVTDVTVKYSPFWVSSIPAKTSKITIQVQKPSTASVQSK